MKNTKNKTTHSLRVLSIPAVIVAITLTLTLSLDKSKPIAPEVQNEPETVKLAALNLAPAETLPIVTTTTPQITTTEPNVTTTPPATTELPITTTTPPATTLPASTMTTPPITTTAATTTTTPSQPAMPDGAQGINEDGNYYKIEDGQKYVWNPVVGWCFDNGPGTVTIMDAKSDGHRFFIEPDGRLNLGKVVTPDGEVISYEEYQKIREAR